MSIPRQEVFRKAEVLGVPVWEVPHARRTYAVRVLEDFCRWVMEEAEETVSSKGLRMDRPDIWHRLKV